MFWAYPSSSTYFYVRYRDESVLWTRFEDGVRVVVIENWKISSNGCQITLIWLLLHCLLLQPDMGDMGRDRKQLELIYVVHDKFLAWRQSKLANQRKRGRERDIEINIDW